ncbi:hypothetical protein RIF29_31016 [Crotalaria pallida]|uniref:RING-type domain-containing protein n=1 Tax=Crotalaria pallida TaxID=3830 RepID=A0AAN9HWZ8_CROPI
MDNNNNDNNRVHRILVSPQSPPPSPPLFSYIVALSISMLIFMCIYVFSIIISVAILLALFITSVYLFRFKPQIFDIETRERNIFYGQTQQNNQRVVRIFDKLFWVVEENGGNGRRQGSVKKTLLGYVIRYGSQGIMTSSSSSSCGSDCAICLEDFKDGEECLIFPICDHFFHLICIHRWLENKLTCPICRYCIPSTMITKTRSVELLANLV